MRDMQTTGDLLDDLGEFVDARVRRRAGGDDRTDPAGRRFGALLHAQTAWRLGRHATEPDLPVLLADARLIALPRLHELTPREGRLTPVVLSDFATTIRWLANARIGRRLRRSAEQPAVPVDSESRSDEVRGTLPRILEDETASLLREALERLDDSERTVVILRGGEGLPDQEVSEEPGQHPNTTSRHDHRAVARLRTLLPASRFAELVDV